MSLSDLLNISRTVRRDKAREQELLPTPTSNSAAVTTRLCNICFTEPATYNCPRCNIPYCSLVCFRRSEHQDCSTAFSSSAIRLHSDSDEVAVEDDDRNKVVHILSRLEKDDNEAKRRQQEEEEESDEDEHEDEDAGLRAEVTREQIEKASTDALLAMLTPKERIKFMDAVKTPKSAAHLMQKLDRKADRRPRLESSASPQGVLIVPQSPDEHCPRKQAAKRDWQSTPWFETADASPNFSSRASAEQSSFVATIERILEAGSNKVSIKEGPAAVNLLYNLCATLMAYTYTLRHLDIPSLSERLRGKEEAPSIPVPAPLHEKQLPFHPYRQDDKRDDDDEDEPPPLEPDDPISIQQVESSQPRTAGIAATTCSIPPSLEDLTIAEEALNKLGRLVPFLFSQPPPATKGSRLFADSKDASKVVLTSLDDASMWFLSRLALDSEVGAGGADALDLQLSADLIRLLTSEQFVPSFSNDQEAEAKFRLASKFTSLPPQQEFAAAQTPLVLNAVADLYFFLGDLAALVAAPSSPLSHLRVRSKSIKLAQRKLCFYFCSAVLGNQQASTNLGQELHHHVESLRRRIEQTEQADKLAAAVSLLNQDDSASLSRPSINTTYQ
ncbi:uncharacterized protein UTRI_05306 [Ustilago trichophora]|uniref:HIT-type domain-containing protein n=1 Tax=Ustilago trichophora TaxID=86804 RepID=A0A5C3EN83_9BASI|nr:uncharacterized protein UTRI_05306 [Ustilago trichophora]